MARAEGAELLDVVGRDGDDRASGGLGEQADERVRCVGEHHRRTDAADQAGFAERLGQATVGEVVSAGRDADQVGEQPGQVALGDQVDLRRATTEVAVHDVRPLAARQLLAGAAEQHDPLTGCSES